MTDEPTVTPVGMHVDIQAALGAECLGHEILEDQEMVTKVTPYGLFEAAKMVRDADYRILSLLSAYDGGDHFGVLYAFVTTANTPEEFKEMRLRVVMPKKNGDADVEPECPSLCDLFAGANWHEREMYDMYGITFSGHPDPRRMFLPEGWKGFPMRKDYAEDEQFVGMEEGEDIVTPTQEEGTW